MSNALVTQQSTAPSIYDLKPVELESIEKSLKAVHGLKQRVMQDGTHFGVIPGTDKPTLYKPGAEILLQLFRLTSRTRITFNELEKGHREYSAEVDICTPDGAVVATGIGVCSTMESKYRYRNDYIVSDVDVPREYWDRRRDRAKNSELQAVLASALGREIAEGAKLATKKDANGAWKIAISCKGEHPDIADVYNTCAKMAKKRALMDGTITATASSSLFTQDVEDFADWSDDVIDVTPGKSERVNTHTGEVVEQLSEEEVKKNLVRSLHKILTTAKKRGYIASEIAWCAVEMELDTLQGYMELTLEELKALLTKAVELAENDYAGFDQVPDFAEQPPLLVEKQPEQPLHGEV